MKINDFLYKFGDLLRAAETVQQNTILFFSYRNAALFENGELIGLYAHNNNHHYYWGESPYVHLTGPYAAKVEHLDDALDKFNALNRELPFDPRIKIELDLSDGEFLQLSRLAHERDITINELINDILAVQCE